MIKSYDIPIPQVNQFSGRVHHFLPQQPDATTTRYETENIQLVDTHLDYHSVLIYRIEAYVEADCILPLKTERSDFHLLYAVKSPAPIVIQNSKCEDQITFPEKHGTYAYVPKGKFDINLQSGHYLVYGLLIDVGFIRAHLFPTTTFLHEYRTARLRNKKKLYQTPIWPIKGMTHFQLQRLEEVFFHYHADHEAHIITMIYCLFEIARQKQYKTYIYVDPNEDLAKRIHNTIKDQVALEFSAINLGGFPERFGIGQKTLIKIHKRYFKQTLDQYLHECIIKKAKDLLARYSVGETAAYCGYNHTSSFSDFFKKEVGMRPSAYQQEILRSDK